MSSAIWRMSSGPKSRNFDTLGVLKKANLNKKRANPKRMERVHIIAHGIVQGVSFRANTIKMARELGLKGYARNMPDGTVEITAEGPKDNIGKLIDYCKKSPGASEVSRIDVKFQRAKNEFGSFDVKH